MRQERENSFEVLLPNLVTFLTMQRQESSSQYVICKPSQDKNIQLYYIPRDWYPGEHLKEMTEVEENSVHYKLTGHVLEVVILPNQNPGEQVAKALIENHVLSLKSNGTGYAYAFDLTQKIEEKDGGERLFVYLFKEEPEQEKLPNFPLHETLRSEVNIWF